MLRRLCKLCCLGSLLLAAVSCRTGPPDLKPSKPLLEDFSLPPETDARFDKPKPYPKSPFDVDPIKAKKAEEADQSSLLGRQGTPGLGKTY
jgi:hypothetical protein